MVSAWNDINKIMDRHEDIFGDTTFTLRDDFDLDPDYEDEPRYFYMTVPDAIASSRGTQPYAEMEEIAKQSGFSSLMFWSEIYHIYLRVLLISGHRKAMRKRSRDETLPIEANHGAIKHIIFLIKNWLAAMSIEDQKYMESLSNNSN